MTSPVVLRSGADAEESARTLAASFAVGADDRDRQRRRPFAEIDALSQSGLLGIGVPIEFGGAQVPVASLVEVFRVLAGADPSIAQIPHSHFVFLEALRLAGTHKQQARFFGEALAGARFANAQTERGSATVTQDATRLRRQETGGYLLDGEKFYATGSLFAHWLVVRAVLADTPPGPGGRPPKVLVFVRRDTDGITVVDDWDGLGQRTTGSGTVRFVDVVVDDEAVVPYESIFTGPSTYGARAQVLHAAIDAGIARGALTAGSVRSGQASRGSGGRRRARRRRPADRPAGRRVDHRPRAEALLRDAAPRSTPPIAT